MKHKTKDRGRFYVTEQIGEKRSTTPEGFLVCHDVPIARTGQQLYMADEVPVEALPNGEIRIERFPEEVFRPETIASFEGKAVTVEHPNDFVTPENWQQLAVGTVQNVRRGEGLQDDLLIADLVITDKKAIEYVNKDLPEVSAGYEADYEQTEPGRGVQRSIVGNHVALVERGRAGPRCSIQDKEPTMKKRSFWDRIMTAVKAQDAEAVKAEMACMDQEEGKPEEPGEKKPAMDEGGEMEARIARLEAAVAKMVEAMGATGDEDPDDQNTQATDADEEGNEEEETKDTILEAETAESNPDAKGKVLSGDSLKAVIARAEILAPGITVPTGDSVKGSVVENLQRKALATAYGTDKGKGAIDPFLAGRELKKLTGDSLSAVFTGAAELVRVQNNNSGVRSGVTTKDFGRATSVADINARNREFWDARRAH